MNERLASQATSQAKRLNSIVQVIITVLLNTSIAECVCLAFSSGSVPFELFIHLGRFLFCIMYTYACKLHLLSNEFSFSKECRIATGSTASTNVCRPHISFE
jgi:hypothetical protein